MISSEERSRQALQQELDAEKTPMERNIMGQFSTPYYLACDIVRFLKTYTRIEDSHILEPAFGTGVFFSALRDECPSSDFSMTGYEIDPHYFIPTKNLWSDKKLISINADFLTSDIPVEKYSLIISNPPYSRHHYIDREKKKYLQQKVLKNFGIKISGLAGLYSYFLILSSLFLKNNALSCWLIPSEFMDVNYGKAIKEFLLKKVDLLHIHIFPNDDLKFSDALVSSSIVLFKNSAPSDHDIIFTSGRKILHPKNVLKLKHSEISSSLKWSNLFDNYFPKHNVDTIGDFFSIKRGIATGDNSFFILDDKKICELGIPSTFLTPVLPKPKEITGTLVTSQDGIPVLEKKLFVFNCNSLEEALQKDCKAVWNYIQEGKKKKTNLRYLCRHRTPWYSCEKRLASPFVIPYMGRCSEKNRVFRFIQNDSNAIATNAYLMIYPKNEFSEILSNSKVRKRVLEYLNSISVECFLENGRKYGGGLYKLEPKELQNIPVPQLSSIIFDTSV